MDKFELPNRHYFILDKDGIAFGRYARIGGKTLYTLNRTETESVCDAWRASPHSARCEWTQIGGGWETACSGFTGSHPATFCHYCGRPVREVKAKA